MRVCLLLLCTLIATSYIVAGYGSPEAQFEGWMSSPGHCRAIMNPDHYYVGLGTFLGTSGYGQYTTANFGAR